MKIILLFAALLLFIQNTFGQCSDAGVCSLGNLKTYASSKNHQIGLEYIYSYSHKRDKISYNTVQVSAATQLFEKNTINIKLPFIAAINGPLGDANGLGDIIISLNQNIYDDLQNKIFIQMGLKLATGDANKKAFLPMAYQTGLGTNDFLFGILYTHLNWTVSTGYQLAEHDRNDNDFTKLKRGDDIYAKMSYRVEFAEYSLTSEILAIKRLQKSSTIIAGTSEKMTEKDSDPFQINVGGVLSYSLSPSINLNIRTVFALLKRKNNVDGLTRGFTFGIGSVYNF